jgi:hypothetical protein
MMGMFFGLLVKVLDPVMLPIEEVLAEWSSLLGDY